MLGPKNNDLKSISDFNSKWADRIALLIIVGLGVDIAEVLILGKEWPEWALTIAANSLIAGGVWGELWFAKRAREADDSRVAEANASAANANERAAQLTLDLEKEKAKHAPRHLTERQIEELQNLKGRLTKIQLMIAWDIETTLFAAQIRMALGGAGISIERLEPFGSTWSGIVIASRLPPDKEPLVEIFKKAQLAPVYVHADLMMILKGCR